MKESRCQQETEQALEDRDREQAGDLAEAAGAGAAEAYKAVEWDEAAVLQQDRRILRLPHLW